MKIILAMISGLLWYLVATQSPAFVASAVVVSFGTLDFIINYK